MRVLVLGAGGMAGHVVSLYLKDKGFNLDTLSAKNKLNKNTYLLDVLDSKKFEKFLGSKQYGAVVNCIGILVRQSDERKDLAAYINSYLPHLLEEFYKDSKTRVIHISTNGVFSNKKSTYKEGSAYDAQDFYGRSKALGELNNSKDLTFRMSIIGPDMRADGISLFNWFMQQKGEISGYDKVFWQGITTIELAKAIKAALDQKLTGIYHLVPAGTMSKFDLLKLFKEVFDRKDIKIKLNSDASFDQSLLNTRTDFKFSVSDYKPMVEEMKSWINSHKNLYPHYN